MSTRSRIPEVPEGERTAFAGELLGAPVRLAPSADRPRGLEGVLVDESLSMFSVRIPGRTRVVRVAKAGLAGTIVLGGRELPLRGDALRVRPEDRTKRLLARGPRRIR
jgi:RNase P/RNase MRP subunit p29